MISLSSSSDESFYSAQNPSEAPCAHDLSHSSSINEPDCPNTTVLFPNYLETIFCCLKQTTPVRYHCLQWITSPWFERISIFIILLNCITLGLYQPCANHKAHPFLHRCLQIIDDLIFALFVLEMIIKILAMGFIGQKTYLADPWNRLDCLIILAG